MTRKYKDDFACKDKANCGAGFCLFLNNTSVFSFFLFALQGESPSINRKKIPCKTKRCFFFFYH